MTTEAEAQFVLEGLNEMVKDQLPAGWGYMLILRPPGDLIFWGDNLATPELAARTCFFVANAKATGTGEALHHLQKGGKA